MTAKKNTTAQDAMKPVEAAVNAGKETVEAGQVATRKAMAEMQGGL